MFECVNFDTYTLFKILHDTHPGPRRAIERQGDREIETESERQRYRDTDRFVAHETIVNPAELR